MTTRPTYRDIYGYLPEPCVRLLESADDGEALMARVVTRLGGVSVVVPVRLSAGHRLVEELGPVDAERVWRVWRGDGAAGEIRVVVPRMTAAMIRARDRRLLSLTSSGVTVADAARRYGLTERAVYLALARAREFGDEAPRQLDLFPA